MLIVDLYFNWANQTTNQKIMKKKHFTHYMYNKGRNKQKNKIIF